MDYIKELTEHEECEEFSWKKDAIKQGYLIKFHRSLLKAPSKTPKMQYFVLTANGLISFEGRPDHDTKPLSFLPYEQLSSIKLDQIELNSCKLCCMQLTSKITASFTLGFSRKEERDDWMMIMMKSFSEALLTTRVFNKSSSTSDEERTSSNAESSKDKLERTLSGNTIKEKLERKISSGSYGQSLRRKRRKGDKGSIRKSKSYDSLALHDVTNIAFNFPNKGSSADPLRPKADNLSYLESRKRKSVPDINVISHFPSAWTTESKEKQFPNGCSFEHRDSLTVQAEKQQKNKCNVKHKINVFAKLRSKLEHPIRSAH